MKQDEHPRDEARTWAQDLPQGAGMNCLLTLALPLALEEAVLDCLREQTDLMPGFFVVQGQGLGSGAVLLSPMERVQGRARRVFVQAVMHEADLMPLVARLAEQIHSPQVSYWATPLLTSGRLA
jgi:hypothetical protein